MKKEIKYIGFYDLPESKIKRVSSLSSKSKMDYIGDALNKAGFAVHFVSPSWTSEFSKAKKLIKQYTLKINKNKRITFCPTFTTNNKFMRNLNIIFTLGWLFLWLVKNTKRNEKILMYHVPWLSIPVRWAKKIKGFKLILEVEEIYGDVSVIHPYFYLLENKLIESADAYLFSTDLLAKKIGAHKPFVVIYGVYKTYPQLAYPIDDRKIHLLYAGIIDTHKAGAFNAIEAAKHLSNKYVLHIIGFGEIELLQKKITEINFLNGCQIFYDGSLTGEDYIRYCQQCHIGLSTQNSEGKYLETSFPSKILSYLSMGLNVISGPIECVQKSKIGNIVNYYNYSSPESISESIKMTEIKSKEMINNILINLEKDFIIDIKSILLKN